MRLRFDHDYGFVSTLYGPPFERFETVIQDYRYEDRTDYTDMGPIVNVEVYETEEEAVEGHKKYVALMSTKPLPESISDTKEAFDGVVLEGDEDLRAHTLKLLPEFRKEVLVA